jgi:hypothetical protein
MTSKNNSFHSQEDEWFNDRDEKHVTNYDDYDDFAINGTSQNINRMQQKQKSSQSHTNQNIYSSKHTRIRENRTSSTKKL